MTFTGFSLNLPSKKVLFLAARHEQDWNETRRSLKRRSKLLGILRILYSFFRNLLKVVNGSKSVKLLLKKCNQFSFDNSRSPETATDHIFNDD